MNKVKLTALIHTWDLIHGYDLGELGFCDLVHALEDSGVVIENDVTPCQPREAGK